MTRVLLKGYYGFRNTGDDALLAASAWGARQAYGTDVALTAVAGRIPVFPGSELTRAAYPAAGRLRGEARVRVWLEALKARAVVFGGGSVFHAGERLAQVETLLRIAGRGPHLAAGVSIGPFRSSADERACARVLRRLAFVGARDAESAALARSLAPDVQSRLTFDLAPLLLALGDGTPAPRAERRGVGVSLCDYERFTGGDERREALRRARIAQALRCLDPGLVDEIVFLDFNGDPACGDAQIHADVRAMLDGARISVRHVPYDSRPLEVLRTVAGLRAMIAMRLHAAVFGFLARTPTVILSYHPKCRGWAAQAGVPPSLVHDSVGFAAAELADAVTLAAQGRARPPSMPIPDAVERARLNFPPMAP
jgi:polysaccharide pyruvyl transferase WcaK-like protein